MALDQGQTVFLWFRFEGQIVSFTGSGVRARVSFLLCFVLLADPGFRARVDFSGWPYYPTLGLLYSSFICPMFVHHLDLPFI